MSNAPSTPSIVGAEGWHTTMPPTTSQAATQGAFEVANVAACRRGQLVDNRPSEGGRERLANIHPRAAKATLGISPRYTAHHRSVGRLSAQGYKIMPLLSWLRVIAPLQHQRPPKVATLARAFAQYTATLTTWTIHTVCYLCWNTPVDSLQSRLGELASLIPSTLSKPLKNHSDMIFKI